MSRLPRSIRLQKAKRETYEMWDLMAYGRAMDAGFDGGEWSGPANSREEHRRELRIAMGNRVLHTEVYNEIQVEAWNCQMQEGDAIGEMMGTNI